MLERSEGEEVPTSGGGRGTREWRAGRGARVLSGLTGQWEDLAFTLRETRSRWRILSRTVM